MKYLENNYNRLFVNWSLKKLDINDELPRSLIQLGTLIIVSSIVVLLLLGAFLRYNDTIDAPITVTTTTMPIDIVTKSSGDLTLLVEENAPVEEDEWLAFISNSANFEDIRFLMSVLQDNDGPYSKAFRLCSLNDEWNIGELQDDVIEVSNAYKNYVNFVETNEHDQYIAALEEEKDLHNNLRNLLTRKNALLEKDLSIDVKKLRTDTILFKEKIISEIDLDRSKQTQIQKTYQAIDNSTSINQIEIQIKQLEQNIITSTSEYMNEVTKLEQNMINAIDILESNFKEWESKYILKSPIQGICTRKDFYVNNQFIDEGESIFTISPEEKTDYFGILRLPTEGAGKVMIGQIVNIHLDNYPSKEFGIIRGEVQSIALLPSEDVFNVRVSFPEGLKSSYNIEFPFQQLMSGNAEVITNEMSFMERILNQVRAQRLNR